MHEITTESIVFYAASWVVAFCACLCRAVRDTDNFRLWNVLASCGMAGFLAFGLIGFLVDGDRLSDSSTGHTHWYYLALAALLGIVAKDPDKIAWGIIEKVLGAIRKDDKDK